MAEHRHRAHDLDTGRVRRDEDLRSARVRRPVGVGDSHHDPERRAVRPRGEPLVTVDHPLVPVAPRARLQRRRVGAGLVGLGHREERADLAGDEREEPALLLLGRAEEMEDLGVARVGRLAPEHELGVGRAADLLVQVRVREEPATGPPGLGRDVRRPEPGLLRLRLERADQLGVVALEGLLVRIDVLLHERPVAPAQIAKLVGRCEVGDRHAG
jgi:hypothetical protein